MKTKEEILKIFEPTRDYIYPIKDRIIIELLLDIRELLKENK